MVLKYSKTLFFQKIAEADLKGMSRVRKVGGRVPIVFISMSGRYDADLLFKWNR